MLRKIAFVLVLAVLMLLAGTVAGQDYPTIPEGEVVNIRFQSYNIGSAAFGAGTQRLIDTFNATHPNIVVEGVRVTAESPTAQVQADMVAGTPVDVAQLIFSDLDFIVNNLNPVPLETIVPPEEWEANLEGFSPNGLTLGQFNGETYGFAYTFSTPMFFYNATIFEAAGLDPENPPTTWEEVRAAALQIAENTDFAGVHVSGPFGAGSTDWIIQSMIFSNGGEVLSEDRTTLMFGEEGAVGAVEVWRDLYQSGAHSRFTEGEAIEAWLGGQLGMYLQSSALYNASSGAAEGGGWDLRATYMPSFGDRPTSPVNSGAALFIFAQDPAKQRAAWEFVKWATGYEGYTIIVEDMGYVPLRPDIVEFPEYLQTFAEENPYLAINLDQLTRLRAWTSMPGPNYRQIVTIMMDAMFAAITTEGDVDVAAIMQDAQARAQELMP
ncbi:MAG: ABC transporter substrate-binding protein [Chloroflexota bacterium]|nr:ABC transporter substrate-binding protein [Chloroflexota bacterium]